MLSPGARTLATALVGDPVSRWTYGVDDRLEERLTRAFTLWLAGVVDLGDVWSVGDGAGVATWIPADHGADIYTHDLRVREAINALTLDGGKRHDRFWDWVDACRRHHDNWYLDMIGVSAAHRNQGLGAALVNHGLERARAEGVRAGLIAFDPPQVRYFQRLGFAVTFEGNSPDGGPSIWMMEA